jgi:uncharacterized protein (DUF58 family)
VTTGLTGRGWALLAAAALGYAAGEYLGYPVLRALTAVAAAVVLASVLVAARRLPLRVARKLDRTRVVRGRTVEVHLEVHNRGLWWTPAFAAEDGAPVQVPGLRPGGRAAITYTMTPQRRGQHSVGPLRVAQTDPLGLTDRRRQTGEGQLLWVYPRLHPARPVGAGLARATLAGGSTGSAVRGSQELRALRPYQRGDDLRHVHWNATAASGDLMVRDLYDPPVPQLLVLLDTRPSALPEELFEEAVDFAASVLVAAGDAGHRARLRTTGGLDVGSGFLEALCTVRQQAASPRPAPVPCIALYITGAAAAGADDLRWLAACGRGVLAVPVGLPAPAGLRAAAGLPPVPAVTVLTGAGARALTARWNAAVR